MNERLAAIDALVRTVPDFPKPGIQFKDITTMLRNPKAFADVIELIASEFQSRGIQYVVGIESRGFIIGAPVAARLGVGFVPVRKPGKLPAAVDRVSYSLEYGTDSLEMHKDALDPGSKVLIVDDVIATGGTVSATIDLVQRQRAQVAGLAFVIELSFLNGRSKLPPSIEPFTLLRY